MPNGDDLRGDFPVAPSQLVDGQFLTPGIQAGAPPEQIRLPSLADMSNMSLGELEQLLEYYGIKTPWDSMVAQAGQYVSRMTELRPGSLEWAAERDRVLDTRSRLGMLRLNRRVAQTWSSLDAIDGDPSKTMIWLTEMDDHVCDPCEENAGVEKTWAEWQASGPPGAAVCRGGDSCRCDLVVVED